jgi:Fe-S-cluster-containing hydrogenase component 2
MSKSEGLYNSGVLPPEMYEQHEPPKDLWESKKNGLVIVECPQRIPCNPCHTGCPTRAIMEFADINDIPKVDYSKCTGCAMCVAKCPGLACFVADLTYGGDEEALLKLPYEMLPLPDEGEEVECLNREGKVVSKGKVLKIVEPWKDKTKVVHVAVPKSLVMEIRAIRVVRSR